MYSVSIIIANYNREKYIIETLKSIKNQTLVDWECIVIDDGSTDKGPDLINNFIKDDCRFQLFLRPKELNKGANVCRNYGFSKSKGDFIKFYDSDDLMLSQHLDVLVKLIKSNNLDFAVGDSRNFDEKGLRERPFEIDRKSAIISLENFALYKVAWITDDLLLKREFAELCEFHTGILDQGSEYHYNLKLLSLTTRGILSEEVLTHRRLHSNNLVNTEYLINNDIRLAQLKFTAMQCLEGSSNSSLQRWFLSGFVQLGFKIVLDKRCPPYILKSFPYLVKYYSLQKAFLYPIALLIGFFCKKGYRLIKFIRT